MTEKHQYIKKLYKEGNLKEIEKEANHIINIIEKYKQELAIKNKDTKEILKIKKTIQYNEKLLKFIERVKCLLIKNFNNKE